MKATALKQKLQMQFRISTFHSILALGQPILSRTIGSSSSYYHHHHYYNYHHQHHRCCFGLFFVVVTYLWPSLPVEHRPSTTPRHHTLFWAALVIPDQLVPCCFSSASVSRIQLLRGRPVFVFPCGFQVRAWRVVLDAGFLRVCPIQPHFLLQYLLGHWFLSRSLPQIFISDLLLSCSHQLSRCEFLLLLSLFIVAGGGGGSSSSIVIITIIIISLSCRTLRPCLAVFACS